MSIAIAYAIFAVAAALLYSACINNDEDQE